MEHKTDKEILSYFIAEDWTKHSTRELFEELQFLLEPGKAKSWGHQMNAIEITLELRKRARKTRREK